MNRASAIAVSLLLMALAAGGCAQNPSLQGQSQALQQQMLASQQRTQELQSRASSLDQENQELQTLVAQTRQQSKLLEDQLAAVREQLSGTTSQMAQLRNEKQLTEQQVEAMSASTRLRGGATITANNSLKRNLPIVALPGIEVRPDGDVVRIELPAAKIFQPGTTTLLPTGGPLIDSVAGEIARNYPDQYIGIEGHTDTDPVRGSLGGTNQQLSAGRALAVFQYVTARNLLQSPQLFTVGHAGNHPVVSNATAAGKQRNNRVELVIYPDRLSGR